MNLPGFYTCHMGVASFHPGAASFRRGARQGRGGTYANQAGNSTGIIEETARKEQGAACKDKEAAGIKLLI